MGSTFLNGFPIQGAGNNRLDLGVGQLAGLAGAGRIAQRPQSAVEKTLPPLAHGLNRYPALGDDGGIGQASGAIQNDPGVLGGALIGLGPPRHQFKLGLLFGVKK